MTSLTGLSTLTNRLTRTVQMAGLSLALAWASIGQAQAEHRYAADSALLVGAAVGTVVGLAIADHSSDRHRHHARCEHARDWRHPYRHEHHRHDHHSHKHRHGWDRPNRVEHHHHYHRPARPVVQYHQHHHYHQPDRRPSRADHREIPRHAPTAVRGSVSVGQPVYGSPVRF